MKMLRARSYALTITLALTSTACLEKCAPGKVGPGVARLTARNMGAMVQLINDDTRCGFESPDVKNNPTLQGVPGSEGHAIMTVENCEIDLTSEPMVTEDCNGVKTSISGRVIISATRTVMGTLTGDNEQPAVPVTADGVTIEITRAEFDQFRVESSDSDAVLTQISGAFSGVAKPRLAADTAEGICMIPTPNIEMSQMAYTDAKVHVVGEGRRFHVDVPTSNITVVNGVHGDRENFLGGTIKVWGKDVTLNNDDGLNPDYSAASFVESFACEEDLALPVSFECANLGPVLAQNAARLTIREVGAIANLVEDNENCGFSSPASLGNPELNGQIGQQGTATFRVSGCVIELPEGYALKTDCNGVLTEASGKITVSASKVMQGRLTGDYEEPVVPMNDHPATVILESVLFENFRVAEDGNVLIVKNGNLAGQVTPRVALSTENGACAEPTYIARFEGVRWTQPADVRIEADQGKFEVQLEASDLTAVNGAWNGDENMLTGSFSLFGETYSLPVNPNDAGLNPDYDPEAFTQSWLCGNIDPNETFECHFVKPLAQGASQLTAMTMGMMATIADENDTCGFSSPGVKYNPEIVGEIGEPGGRATFTITEPCEVTYTEPTVVREDCNGKQTYAVGTVRFTGTRTVEGYVSGDPEEAIVPTSRDPAEVNLSVEFGDFALWDVPGENRIEVRSGRLTGSVEPRLAIDSGNGACSLTTPVVAFDKMIWSSAEVTIESEGRRFDATIGSSNLRAQNGNRDGVENVISGAITIDGQPVPIPWNNQGLDPNYDPVQFIQSFACEENMELPADEAACDMQTVIAEGTARLLVSAMGSVTGQVNADNDCGYSKIRVLLDPSVVEGQDGQQGAMEWEIEDCQPGYDTPMETDCLGRESYISGEVTITGRRRVEGIRKEINVIITRIDSIEPDRHDSVTVWQDNLQFNEYAAWDKDPDTDRIARGITIHEGSMSGVVYPVTGRADDGAYDIPTKVAHMQGLTANNLRVQIIYDNKRFNAVIDSAQLEAFNGSWIGKGLTNHIEGQIVMNGTTYPLPAQGLDPDYDQATFDQRYECTDDLSGLITPAP